MTDNQQPEVDFQTSKAILRLLVGLTLEGTDELSRRLREWESQLMQKSETVLSPSTDSGDMSEGDRLYYALIGMAFTMRQRAEDNVADWFSLFGRATQYMSDAADTLARNPLLRPFVKPIRDRADALGQQMQNEIERWIEIGKAEEQHSRALARVAVPEIVEDVLQIMAENPELQALIQRQSVGLAEEVVDSVREVTVTADAVLEGLVRKLLNRKPRQQLPAQDIRLLTEPHPNGHKGPHNDDRA